MWMADIFNPVGNYLEQGARNGTEKGHEEKKK